MRISDWSSDVCSSDLLAFRSALAEAAGDEDAVHRVEPGDEILFALLEQFGVEPADVDLDPVRHAAVDQRLVQRFIGVGQRDIFADDADRHLALRVPLAVHDRSEEHTSELQSLMRISYAV